CLQVVAQSARPVIDSHRRPDLTFLIHAHKNRIARVAVASDILLHAAVVSFPSARRTQADSRRIGPELLQRSHTITRGGTKFSLFLSAGCRILTSCAPARIVRVGQERKSMRKSVTADIVNEMRPGRRPGRPPII